MKIENFDESIAMNENRYRDLSRRFADSIWVLDAHSLKVLFVSDSTQSFRGYGMKEILGSYLKEITTEDSYHWALIELTRARREYEKGKDPSPRLEFECCGKEGITTWVEIVAKFVREKEEPLQLVCISRDISDRKIDETNKGHLLKMYMDTLTEETRLRSDIELLEKLLPICRGCRQIRDDENQWWPIEAYVREKAGGRFTGTLCPQCTETYRSRE